MVKVAGRLAIVFFLFSFMILEVHGQKYMSISDDLNENSDRFDLGKRSGWGMFRYYFNSFEVFRIKGKGKLRLGSVSPESYSFGRSKTKSNTGFSFGFASDRGDTALVHADIAYEDNVRVSFFGSIKEVNERSYSLSGVIETNDQNSDWKFTISQEKGTEMGNRSTYFGRLTNGERCIEIVPVLNYQNPGIKNLMDILVGSEIWLKGFEFVENNKPIGAVQTAPFRSASVWFSRENDPMIDFVLGATFAALLRENQAPDPRSGLWF